MKKSVLLAIINFTFLTVVTAQTTDLYDMGSVHELKIEFKQLNWPELLDSMRLYGDGMLTGKVTIDGVPYDNVGIGYRGTVSFQTGAKRNPIQIKLDYINRGQNHQGYKAIKLSNSLRDPSLVREVLGYEIARKYMHAPKANYMQLQINKENMGLYVNIEALDNVFLDKHFGSSDNTFVKAGADTKAGIPEGCTKTYASLYYDSKTECFMRNYEMVSKTGWDELIELTRILKDSPKDVTKVLNVDQALWMLAFNNVLVNLHSYSGAVSQNYYMYKDDSGQFNPIIWDLNLCFGSFKNTLSGSSDLSLEGLQSLDPLLHQNEDAKPLIKALLQQPEYKKIYLSHIKNIVSENFENDWYLKRAQELQKLIQVPFSNDPYKFYSVEEFNKSLTTTIGQTSKIPGIAELMSKRSRFLRKHPDLLPQLSAISDVKVMKRGKYGNEPVTDFVIQAKVDKFPKKVVLYYRPLGEKNFTMVAMQDDGKSKDENAGDKIFGVTVKPNGAFEAIEYYIMAENVAMVSYEPVHYFQEWKKISLQELNN